MVALYSLYSNAFTVSHRDFTIALVVAGSEKKDCGDHGGPVPKLRYVFSRHQYCTVVVDRPS